MPDDARKLVNLLSQILDMHAEMGDGPVGSSPQTQTQTQLMEILANYQADRESITDSNASASAELADYVEFEIAQRFVNLDDTEDNFNTDDADLWKQFLSLACQQPHPLYAVAVQLVVSLANNSLVNKQKLAAVPDLKPLLLERLQSAQGSPLLLNVLAELYCLLLFTNCRPRDLLAVYAECKRHCPVHFRVLNALAGQLSDPYSQSFLQFENAYRLFRTDSSRDQCTLQLWIELNNTTSNRILTVGNDIFLEVKEAKLCIANDEYILALFDGFEFDTNTMYQLTLAVDGDDIALYVDGGLVQHISLVQGSIKRIRRLELGSMICSFKLYKFMMWSELLYEASVRLLCEVGLLYQRACDQSPNAHDVLSMFGDHLLQKVHAAMDTAGMTYGLCAQQVRQLKSENLVEIVDPRRVISTSRADPVACTLRWDNGEGNGEGTDNDVSIGKVYYYQAANVVSCFAATDSFSIVLALLDDSADLQQAYTCVEHLLLLLKHPGLKSEFEKSFGYPLLAHVLARDVLRRLQQPLSVDFLNLFLEFCGWDIADPSRSILASESAYASLILNLELWLPREHGDSKRAASLEIVRFLFFQLGELVQTSRNRLYNSKKLQRLGVIQRLTQHQHVAYNKNKTDNPFDELSAALARVYKTLLLEELSHNTTTYLLHFAYYEMRCGYHRSSETVLEAVDAAFLDTIQSQKLDAVTTFSRSMSLKLLLMNLDCGTEPGSIPTLVLGMLFKYLQVNPEYYGGFVKNNGYALLFSIFKTFRLQTYRGLVLLLHTYSVNECVSYGSLPATFAPAPGCGAADTRISMVENHYLIIDMLEWAVMNDITENMQADLDALIESYACALLRMQDGMPRQDAFDPRRSRLVERLTELLLTLRKPQNGTLYEAAAGSVVLLVAGNVLLHLKTLKSSDFAEYMDALVEIHAGHESLSGTPVATKAINYIRPAVWLHIFPEVVGRLVDTAPMFATLFAQHEHMFGNLCFLLQRYKETLYAFQWDTGCYVAVHKCIAAAAETVFNSPHPHVRASMKSSILQTECFALAAMFYLVLLQERGFDDATARVFFKSLLFHQETLFGTQQKHQFFDKEFCSYILLFLARYAQSGASGSGPRTLALNCFRTIVLHRSESLRDIATIISCHERDCVFQLLAKCMCSDDEELYGLLASREARLYFGAHLAVFEKRYVQKNFAQWCQGELVPAAQVLDNVLELKQAGMERRYSGMLSMYQLLKKDNLAFDQKIVTAVEKKLLYFLNDMEDDLLLYTEAVHRLKTALAWRMGIQEGCKDRPTWALESIEDYNRMRKRLVPKHEALCCSYDEVFGADRELQPELQPELSPSSVARDRRASSSIMSFEVINDFQSFEISKIETEDKNSKVLRSLRQGDLIKSIWNSSHVVGLTINEGILIMGVKNLYFINNYFFSSDNKYVIELQDAPEYERDTNIKLITGSVGVGASVSAGTGGTSGSGDAGVGGGGADSIKANSHEVQVWELGKLGSTTKRPFLLRDVALELVFEDGKNCFFSFSSVALRDVVYQQISRVPKNTDIDPVLLDVLSEINIRSTDIGIKNGIAQSTLSSRFSSVFSNAPDLTRSFDFLKKWQNGEISNFYYLMIVNTLAGRTFNDLTQYPVFPWVIADYTSADLDLDDPKTYRDLSRPMGAQSEKRRRQFVERYEALASLGDAEAPPFHYGTHYSSAMIVSSYLIRLEPFVGSYLILQGGKFGHADRLFNSIERAWLSASAESTTDVRELTPEFFFLPDFLQNVNGYDFGALQSGARVDDVVLPPWAKGDPKIFVAKNREALESRYVSENLHKWIDLVFGCKQKGSAAVEAVNVFNRLSYPGAVDLERIDDENERRAVTGIIHNFGQTPLQLFESPHPPRKDPGVYQVNGSSWDYLPRSPCVSNVCNSTATSAEASGRGDAGPGVKHLEFEVVAHGAPVWRGYRTWCLSLDSQSRGLAVGKVSPCSVEVRGKTFEAVHSDEISALAVHKRGQFVSGDKSGLLKLWRCSSTVDDVAIEGLSCFYGHLCEIQEIHTTGEYNTMVTLDSSGIVYSWDVLEAEIIRQFSSTAKHAAVSNATGNVAVVGRDNRLSVYDLNGSLYGSKTFAQDITCVSFVDMNSVERGFKRHVYWKEKDIVGVGLANGEVCVLELKLSSGGGWELVHLKTVATGTPSAVSCLSVQMRIVPLDNGSKFPVNVAKCEIVAGDCSGGVYVWR